MSTGPGVGSPQCADLARRDATDNQTKLQSDFQFIFTALSTLGHDMTTMLDCSDVIPQPPPFTAQATFPAGLSNKDIEQSCATAAFPTLKTDPGPATSVAPV